MVLRSGFERLQKEVEAGMKSIQDTHKDIENRIASNMKKIKEDMTKDQLDLEFVSGGYQPTEGDKYMIKQIEIVGLNNIDLIQELHRMNNQNQFKQQEALKTMEGMIQTLITDIDQKSAENITKHTLCDKKGTFLV